MCGRTANRRNAQNVQQAAGGRAQNFADSEKYRSSYNVGPTRYQPVMRKDGANYEMRSMKWGLIPSWTKAEPDFRMALNTINARDDSIFGGRSMWNAQKNRKRCIVFADGFYEWKAEGKERLPYYISFPEESRMLTMGGLYDVWKDDKGEKVYSYTIVTTPSNSQLSWLHDRMPLILDNDADIERWLDPDVEFQSVRDLVRPYEGKIKYHAVSTLVNKIGNDAPECIQPLPPSSSVTRAKTKPISSFFTRSPTKSSESAAKSSDGASSSTKRPAEEADGGDAEDDADKSRASNKRQHVDQHDTDDDDNEMSTSATTMSRDEMFAQLLNMGFGDALVSQALEHSSNLDEAIAWLVDHAQEESDNGDLKTSANADE